MIEFFRYPFKYNPNQTYMSLRYPDLASGPVSFSLTLGENSYTFMLFFNRVLQEPYVRVYDSTRMIYFIRLIPRFGDGATTNLLYQKYNDFRGLAMYWEQQTGLVFYRDFKFLEKSK